MIKLDMVKKSYGQNEVLNDFTLEVKKHELLSLVGPTGCGKTTTLNIVAGLCRPDQGDVIIDDVLVDGRNGKHLVHVNPSERKVGYVFQDYALFPHMTVRENISYGLKARHLSKKEVKKRSQSLLEFVGLVDRSEHYPYELSGGEKQRVALGRALITEPEILLLDEPLAALDPRTRESLRVELKKILANLEVTSIYVTHELAEAYAVSDRIAVMGSGRIEQIGQRDEIFAQPNSAYVAQFLGQNVYSGKLISNPAHSPAIDINGITIIGKPANGMGERPVLVTIKPEDVVLSSEPNGNGSKWNAGNWNNLEGIIVEIVRMRSTAEVIVDVGFLLKSTITMNSLEELSLGERKRVYVHFKVDSLGISNIA